MKKCIRKFFQEFKEFATRGNAFDLAVGVIIGGAFQKIVSSLVGDVISPLLGLFGNANFDNLVLKIGTVELRYGAFLTTVIDFLIMAFIIFLMVKMMNRVTAFGKKPEPEAEPEKETKVCPYCFSEISSQAVRCPCCTSVLEDGCEEKEEQL